jgi:hypothetical protein
MTEPSITPSAPAKPAVAFKGPPLDQSIAELMRLRVAAIRDRAATYAYCARAELSGDQDNALCQSAFDRVSDLEDAIMEARPTSLSDLAAKAEVVGSFGPENRREWTDDYIYQLVKDIQASLRRKGHSTRGAALRALPHLQISRCRSILANPQGCVADVPAPDPSPHKGGGFLSKGASNVR